MTWTFIIEGSWTDPPGRVNSVIQNRTWKGWIRHFGSSDFVETNSDI